MSSKEAEEKQQQHIAEIINKLDTSQFTYHKLDTEEVIKHLKTNPKSGLTQKEAEARI